MPDEDNPPFPLIETVPATTGCQEIDPTRSTVVTVIRICLLCLFVCHPVWGAGQDTPAQLNEYFAKICQSKSFMGVVSVSVHDKTISRMRVVGQTRNGISRTHQKLGFERDRLPSSSRRLAFCFCIRTASCPCPIRSGNTSPTCLNRGRRPLSTNSLRIPQEYLFPTTTTLRLKNDIR